MLVFSHFKGVFQSEFCIASLITFRVQAYAMTPILGDRRVDANLSAYQLEYLILIKCCEIEDKSLLFHSMLRLFGLNFIHHQAKQ